MPHGTGESTHHLPACLVLCFLGALLPLERGTVTLSGVWTRTWAHLTCTQQIKSLLLVFDLLLCDKAARDVAASGTVSWWDVGRKLHHCCRGQLCHIAGSR